MLTNFWLPLFWACLLASLTVLLLPAETVLSLKVWLAHWLPFGEQLDAIDATQHSDKWIHFTVFAVLGWLGSLAWQPRRNPSDPDVRPPRWVMQGLRRHRLLVGLLFMAVATECLQHWVPGRSASVADFLADVAGLLLGLLAARAGSMRESYVNK